MSHYQDFYRHSVDAPETFWAEQAKLIDWHTPPTQPCPAGHFNSSAPQCRRSRFVSMHWPP